MILKIIYISDFIIRKYAGFTKIIVIKLLMLNCILPI